MENNETNQDSKQVKALISKIDKKKKPSEYTKKADGITNNTGRPTRYTPELLNKAIEYINNGYLKEELVPTMCGLCIYLDLGKTQCQEYGQKYIEFKAILDKIQSLQEQKLIKGGLGNKFNSNITKLMLGKHGYNEKIDITGNSAFFNNEDKEYNK